LLLLVTYILSSVDRITYLLSEV